MPTLLVLADDFTGALDTGVQFSSKGINTLVTTNKELKDLTLEDDTEVLVIDTESRYLSFEKSYQLIKEILQVAKKQGISYFYKKVDSALRGNISSEIKALLEEFPEQKIGMVPAFPEMNRIVRDGKLYIDGIPVSQSIFAKDPYEPVTESDIRIRLKKEAGIEAALVQNWEEPFPDQDLLLFDSHSEEDLEEIAGCLQKKNDLRLSIGCAGFAKYLVKALFPEKQIFQPQVKGPLLVISGSVNPITRGQIEYAQEKGHLRFSLTPPQLLEEGFWESEAGQEELKTYLDVILQSQLVMFETLSDETSQGLATSGMARSEIRSRIGQSLGQLTQQFLDQGIKCTLLFTGGDTLFQSMQVLGIEKIRPFCELSPGVVLAELSFKGRQIQVITKSGGFGHRELFEEISQLVQKEEKYVS